MLHNPYDGTTPSQRQAAVARNARVDRFNQAAFAKKQCEAARVEEARAAERDATWRERQRAIPVPPRPWFSLLSEIGKVESGPVTVSEIVKACCRYFDYSADDFLTPGRFKEVVHARHVAMYLARNLTDKSFAEIGRRLGGLDHSTVLHGVRKIGRAVRKDWAVAYDVAQLEASL